jgi:2-(1,2-epoxy-1,2-dihydrophenyl)acetyl-CoA isomerase
MTDQKLIIKQDAGVLTLVLNRPNKLNAIDNDLASHLQKSLDAAATDASVRAIRILGNGRAFCAGRDVSEAPTEKDLELVQSVAWSIVSNPKPIIAAVHGWTIGAGFEWMLNADIVYASEDAKFKLPEASLGVFVTGGLVATLPAAIGLTRAKALMLLGEEFSARQAADWGLVYRVVPTNELNAVTLDACRRLAELEPSVAAQFKRVLNLFGLGNFARAIEEESRVHRTLGGRAK